MKDSIARLEEGSNLDSQDINDATAALLSEEVADDEKADFLRALAAKGETPEEIAGFVEAFLAHAVDPGLDVTRLERPAIDVCGTGGDKLNLINVSTASMFVLAGGGAAVVKHGNRGITSKSGGADVLESLGIRIDLPPDEFSTCVREHGAAFLFAQRYHPAFKAVAGVRKKLAEEGTRTIFNILGPLLNPVRPKFQMIGVFDGRLTRVFAEILHRLGRERAWAVHGNAGDGKGMDEISTLGTTQVTATDAAGELSDFEIDPAALGFAPAALSDLQGGDANENAGILEAIIDGSEKGARRDIVVLNAAAGFVITGLANDLASGVTKAADVIDSGAAKATLDALRAFGA